MECIYFKSSKCIYIESVKYNDNFCKYFLNFLCCEFCSQGVIKYTSIKIVSEIHIWYL